MLLDGAHWFGKLITWLVSFGVMYLLCHYHTELEGAMREWIADAITMISIIWFVFLSLLYMARS